MNDNIINFYMLTNKLKEKIRTGWIEIGISGNRLESVAEHVYGCMMLAIAIDSEYKLDVDMYKVLKMIALHELEETIMKDFTLRSNITHEEKINLGRECVRKATEGLIRQDEICLLLEEFNEHKTKESIFSYHVDKIECDFQAKMYDLEGRFDLNLALEDLEYYGEDGIGIREKVNTASDVWIEYDKRLYKGDNIFENLINDIQKIEKIDN